MSKGKVTYPDACAAPGKPKSQGGSSTGKRAGVTAHKPPKIKNIGTPRDKGVNR